MNTAEAPEERIPRLFLPAEELHGGDDLFGANPGDLWRSVLRRQPRPISQMALYPDDVIVN